MDIKYDSTKKVYYVEGTVTSNWNLHMERASGGFVSLAVSSVSTRVYAPARIIAHGDNEVIDLDIVHGVVSEDHPKYIRIESESEITNITITTL